jgi:hypothetical protein
VAYTDRITIVLADDHAVVVRTVLQREDDSRCARSSRTTPIQQNLGRSTRAELVRYALDHGFIIAE